jgi:hypothetical protein
LKLAARRTRTKIEVVDLIDFVGRNLK